MCACCAPASCNLAAQAHTPEDGCSGRRNWIGQEAALLLHSGTACPTVHITAHALPQIGYDGRSVDVWASGILLLVMLLGSFPFDHTGEPARWCMFF